MLRRVVVFLIAGLAVAPALPVLASPEGEVAAALVSEESYRHYLDDELYTHEGDNRGFGPEHDLAQANIFSLFASFGLTVTLEPIDYYGGAYHNVVGTNLGTATSDQEYVIGAHYDSFHNPGADDNASGVALVLEAARVLSPYESDFTIRFVAFDREEQGLYGSEAYVLDHIGDNILGMISADMVAYNTGANHVDICGRDASAPHKNALAQSVATYGEGLTWSVRPEMDASDHAPFEWYGFQACLLIEDWGNPYYHSQQDNVDIPNYIDYTYATRITRSVVGFLVDNARVNVDMLRGDYDRDGDVDLDDYDQFALCFTAEGIPPEDPTCSLFDFDLDGDVDCRDWSVFEALCIASDDLPIFWSCVLLPPEDAVGDGSRYLAVTPPEHALPMALLVTGDPDDPDVSCVSRYVRADGRLGTTPVFRTFDQWGTVLVYGEGIVPGTSYRVQCGYGVPESPTLSAPTFPTTTMRWGDIVGPYREGIGWLPPDGSVDVIDVVAILDRFRNVPDAPPLPRADLIGRGLRCIPDVSVDIIDASVCVDAFRGFTYTESTGCSDPCE